ncbi:MAG: adenylate/guanylate cyclase domain-containing protein [Flavobacteriales bacterium]
MIREHMRQRGFGPVCRVISCVAMVLGVATAHAQSRSPEGNSTIHIDDAVLQKDLSSMPGMAGSDRGIDLLEQGATRIILADDTALAARVPQDHRWPELLVDRVPMIPAGATYWIRFPITPDPELKGVPLSLSIVARAPVDLYLNGVRVLVAEQRPLGRTGPLVPEPDFQPLVVQITFACDGKPEVLSARVQSLPGDEPAYPPLRLVLQTARNHALASRLGIHFGLFIGVNLIIALLAFLTWRWDRRERSWWLLALLALVTVIAAICHLGGPLDHMGYPPLLSTIMHRAMSGLFSWRILLVLLVLRALRGDAIGRTFRWWAGPALALTVLNLVIPLMPSTMDLRWTRWVLGSLSLLLFIGLTTEVVRASFRLMRAKGAQRWFAIGALAFVLITVISVVLEQMDTSFGWLGLITTYIFYLSLPLSIAIYLALRSAKNNRLVARQRDELDQEVQERTAELEAEKHEVVRQKERSDQLLLNILPGEVAEELKDTGGAVAKLFDQATILFTDFKGFTEASEQLSPQELVKELNTCFMAFDHIITAHGIEKIKTIGDAYMCAGGLPDPRSAAPVDVVNAALEMQTFMIARKKQRDEEGLPSFEMRVGIHTGPVVAGIVGVKKFQYDIWGDTVNTASRMESSGEVGQVNISEATYALVKDAQEIGGEYNAQHATRQRANPKAFTFTPRGKVQAKGKGVLEMYFVERAVG